MNLVEVWVSNISSHIAKNGSHIIVADYDCYGRKEYQKKDVH